jgi:hypothetical protein
MKVTVRAVCLVLCLIPVATMKASPGQDRSFERLGVVEDWTTRQVIFSSANSGVRAGRMNADARYQQQWLRRSRPAFTGQDSLQALVRGVRDVEAQSVAPKASKPAKPPKPPKPGTTPPSNFKQDWASSLGAGATNGVGTFPAKYNFDVNAPPSCTDDFAAFNTSLAGIDGKPSVVAFNQLYSAQGSAGGLCNHDGPLVTWSYITGPGSVVTSPILSLDGTKIMYVQTSAAGAVLHILKWKAGEGSLAAPVAPTQTVSTLQGCVSNDSCDAQIAISGNPTITNSSPFYDYQNDALYVGDDNGNLHKFTPVLLGTLTEVTTGGWPVTVNAGVRLSSPVYDVFNSGNIFVGDANGRLSFVRETNSTSGTCLSGSVPCLGSVFQALGGAIVDPPVVDAGLSKVYVFNGKDANKGSVYQFDAALGSQVTASVGNASVASPVNIHGGAFDQAYLNSVDGTGHLYVCGKVASGSTDIPAIHRISISAGTMSSSSDGGLALGTEAAECSPVTSVYNAAASAEYLFFSVGDGSNQSAAGCASAEGCLMSLNLTALNGVWNPPTTPSSVTRGYRVPTLAGGAGTSGIIIDNTTFPMSTTLEVTASTTLSGGASTTLAGGPVTTLNGAVSAGAAASQTGSFSAQPTTAQGQTVTITNGALSLTLTATPTVASNTVTFADNITSGRTMTITNGSKSLVITAAGSTSASCTVNGANTQATANLRAQNNQTAEATDFTTLINATNCGSFVGISASRSSAVVTLTATTVGTGGNAITVSSNFTNTTFSGTFAGGLNSTDNGTFYSVGANTTATAANLRLAITRSGNGSTVGVTASSSGAVVTVTAITAGTAGNSITLTKGTAFTNFLWNGPGLSGGGAVPTSITVASGAEITNNDFVTIDSETMQVTSGGGTTTLTVTRGAQSTSVATHADGATVTNISRISPAQTTINVASTSGISNGDVLLVDSEQMTVSNVDSATQLAVTRGANSTAAATHLSGVAILDRTVSSSATTLTLASTSGIATGEYLLIDSEKVLVGSVSGSQVGVTRGQLSTTAAAHSAGADVDNLTTAAADTTIPVTATALFAVNDFLLIDSEIVRITAINPGVSFTVVRGQEGTTAAAHQSPAPVFNLSANTASIYFSFASNSTAGAPCNVAIGVGCAVKLTQVGLR